MREARRFCWSLTRCNFRVSRPDYVGLPTATDERLQASVGKWYPTRFQIPVHANGDGAGKRFNNFIERTPEKFGAGDKRTVVIHAAMANEQQLEKMKELGIIPSIYSSMVPSRNLPGSPKTPGHPILKFILGGLMVRLMIMPRARFASNWLGASKDRSKPVDRVL